MINYTFLEKRFDQLNEDSWLQAEYMVDALLNNNSKEFKKVNPSNEMVDDICYELWREVDSTYNPNNDIPF
jgi:hypothetical protein